MTTRLTLQNQIYEILQKTSSAYGLYTPTKVQQSIDDSLAYISAKMMKNNSGWMNKRALLPVVADNPVVTLPAGCAIVNFLKMRNSTSSTVYSPLPYVENYNGSSDTQSSTPVAWRLVNGAIYLEPIPDTADTQGVLCEYTAFPAALVADGTSLDPELDFSCFVAYAKYRAASQLYAIGSDGSPPWERYESEWAQVVIEMIARRFRVPTALIEFSNY